MAEDVKEPIQVYLDARAKAVESYTKIHSIQKIIGEVLRALDKPNGFIKGYYAGEFPAKVSLVMNIPELRGNEWPNVNYIAEALVTLHSLCREAENRYDLLSDAYKKDLPAPSFEQKWVGGQIELAPAL